MKKKIIPLLLAGSALVIGCKEDQAANNPASTSTPAVATAPAVKKEDAVAVVNGTYISKAALEALEADIAQRTHGQKFPKEQLLEELIQRELLLQEAQKKKLAQSAEVAERIRMMTRSLLSQAALQDYLKANPVSDEDMKAEYEKEVVAKMSGFEYKARHILLKEEDEAKKVIAEVAKDPSKFADLAKEHSTGPSGPQGGDLGWFAEEQMVEPFSKAVVALENGAYSKEPVKTQFGWHVILREDSRKQTPPPFEAIKEQLRPALQQQKIQQMLEALRKSAKVEVLVSLEEPEAEAPASVTTETLSSDEKPAATEADNKEEESKAEEAATAAPETTATDEKPAAADSDEEEAVTATPEAEPAEKTGETEEDTAATKEAEEKTAESGQ